MTAPQRRYSAAWKLASSAGVEVKGSMPFCSTKRRTGSAVMAFCIRALMRSTTGAGVPAGAYTAFQ